MQEAPLVNPSLCSSDLSADPAATQNVLLVVPITTCTLDSGGGQRSHHLYRALAESHTVDVLLVPQAGSSGMESAYPVLFRQIYPLAQDIFLGPGEGARAGRPTGLARPLSLMDRAWDLIKPRALEYRASQLSIDFCAKLLQAKPYAFIAGRYLLPTIRSGVFASAAPQAIPLVLDCDDLDEKVVESRLKAPTCAWWLRPLLAWHLSQTRHIVRSLRPQFEHLWLASDEDLASVRHPSKSVLANIPFRQPLPAGTITHTLKSRVCLFVGSTARMNRLGITHFVDTSWADIRRQVPDAVLRIVGAGGWKQACPSLVGVPGVEIVGAVDDLQREYHKALFCVAPVLEGAGTKIKVLEALMYGKALVSTHHAMRGFSGLAQGSGVLTGADASEMAAHCVRLFREPATALELGELGARAIDESHSPASFARRVQADLQMVTERRTARTTPASAA
jgi:glycosyltransferase involved in cell wall biosynthesis